MSVMARSTRRRSQLVGDSHRVAGIFNSNRYGYDQRDVISTTGRHMAMRMDLPGLDGSGQVIRAESRARISRTEALQMEKARRAEYVSKAYDTEGLRAVIAAPILFGVAALLLFVWLFSVGGLIRAQQSIETTRNSIAAAQRRVEDLQEEILTAKAGVDVAYQATGLGMVPSRSTSVVGITIPDDAIIGPNGLANASEIPVLLGD